MSDTRIHTILNCFVDLNLETDENSQHFLQLPKVSFERGSYIVSVGDTLDINVSLEYPSESGLEEVEVGLVLNNANPEDITVINSSYPQTLIFSAGEQTKTLSFQINQDFIENELESFDLILGFFANTIPGQYITTTVNILDKTNLKEVSINQSGAVLIQGQTATTLEFSVFEGSSKNVTISLDSPSVFGNETVGVKFTNISTSSLDHNSTGVVSLSWAPGEQNKTVVIGTSGDELVEGDEFLEIKLINPTNVNIVDYSAAKLKIIDAAPTARYATANFQGFYIQKGKAGQNVEARYIRRNSTTEYFDNSWRMFIKFGEYIEQNSLTFNPPNTNQSAPVCGDGCISSYNPAYLPTMQQNNIIFFGKNPTTEQYGHLRLRIKNIGTHPCNISGTTIAVNNSITVIVDKFDYSIKLPANDGLVLTGAFYQGNPVPQDTLTECNYDFTFEVDYDGLNFILRNSDNTVSLNKEFNLGAHRFNTTYNSSDAEIPVNHYNLVTGYSNIWPYWDGNPSFFESPVPYCLSQGTTLNTAPQYPVNMIDLQDVLVDGIMFLHQDYANQYSQNTTKTQYTSFNFLPNGQKASNSGCTSANIEFGGWIYSPQLLTTSIPFVVV